MHFLPLVHRELRAQARRRRTYWTRLAVALLGCVLGFGILSPSFRGLIPPDQTGRAWFFALGGAAFLHAIFAGVFATADCISEEKREGTLGLLFLTELQSADISLSKLLVRGIGPLYGLLAILPLLLLPALIGGVAAAEFWRGTVVLVNTAFVSLAIGLCVSTFLWSGRSAMALTLTLVSAWMLAPWLTGDGRVLSTNASAPLPLLGSPLFSAVLVSDAFYLPRPNDFWWAIFWQHCLGWLAIGFSILYVRQSWLEKAAGRAHARRLPRSTAATRAAALDERPAGWLAQRDRISISNVPLLAGLGLGGIPAVFFITQTATKPELLVGLGLAWMVHLLLKLWIVLEACRTVQEFRETRMLETLLLTPLSTGEVVDGMARSIRHRILAPVVLVVAVDFLAVLGGGIELGFGFAGVTFCLGAIFIADAYALAWVGLWRGMAEPTLTRALSSSVLRVLFLPWVLFVAGFGLAEMVYEEASSSPGLMLVLWFLASYVTDAALSLVSILRLTARLREMAANEQKPGRLVAWLQRWRPMAWVVAQRKRPAIAGLAQN